MTESDDPTLASGETQSPAETPPKFDPPDPKLRVRSSGRRTSEKRAKLPVTIRVILPLILLGVLGQKVYEWWRSNRVVVTFVDASGNPVTVEGEIELFSDSTHPADPAPQRLLRGPLPVSGDSFVFSADEVGDGANVRVRSEQFGTAFVTVEADGEATLLHLAPPVALSGVVQDRSGRPIADAQVTAIGWSVRGVALCETLTGADGDFLLSGISGTQLVWSLQLLADGYVVKNVDWSINEGSDPGEAPIVLTESRPIPGRLDLPDGLSAKGLSVGVLRLPSVDAEVAADGSFVLDHVPTRYSRVRLVVRGLPEGYTHLETVLPLPAAEIELEILAARRVRGQVISGHNDKGLANARVFHSHGPRGEELVTCDEQGRFELDFVPPTALEIGAAYTRAEAGTKTTSSGLVDVEAGSGELVLRIPIY
ncbi:MAG: carboxypeptidase-like regulatory domain-containing protein [Planctomycetota bacterium]